MYQWFDFAIDDSSDEIPDKYILTIADEDGDEIVVIVHRVSIEYPLNGLVANEKRKNAQMIVDALNMRN